MQRYTRRAVLTTGALVALSPMLLAGTAQAATATPTSGPQTMRRSYWTPLVGKVFNAKTARGAATVKLRAVQDLPSSKTPGDPNKFSLLFEHLSGATPGDGIMTLSRSGAKPVQLFVTRGSKVYEAVIFRI